MNIQVVRYTGIGDEIKNSIQEQKKIEAIIHNSKQDFVCIEHLKKLMKIEEINMDKDKTWAKIELYLSDMANNLASIEKSVAKYNQLWQNDYDKLINKMHKGFKKLPLIPKKISLIS